MKNPAPFAPAHTVENMIRNHGSWDKAKWWADAHYINALVEKRTRSQRYWKRVLEALKRRRRMRNPAAGGARQSITSAATSIKQVARVFKKYGDILGPVHFDIGAGKYDLAQKWMKQHYPRVKFYREDPYNLPATHNKKAAAAVRKHRGADTITSSNVLNVIKEAEARLELILITAMFLKPGGLVIFQVYKGKASERQQFPCGRQRGDTWQHFKPASFYVPMIKKVFKQVKVTGDFIFASEPKV